MQLMKTDEQMMSSREIAELTGKRHADVMRDIRVMMEALEQNANLRSGCKSTTYVGDNGQNYPQYELDQDTCWNLLLGYDAAARMKVVKRWRELEAKEALPDLSTDVGKLLMIQELTNKQLALIQDNQRLEAVADEAIRTKAYISDKKTATAMATASAKSKEVERLKAELGRNKEHATVKVVARRTGTHFHWHPLKAYTKTHKLSTREVPDEQYGTVKAWSAKAWLDVYGVALSELF